MNEERKERIGNWKGREGKGKEGEGMEKKGEEIEMENKRKGKGTEFVITGQS